MTVQPHAAAVEGTRDDRLPKSGASTPAVVFTVLSLLLWPFSIGGVLCSMLVLSDPRTRNDGMVACLVLSILGAVLGLFLFALL